MDAEKFGPVMHAEQAEANGEISKVGHGDERPQGLYATKTGGYVPSTPEEKRHHRSLNRKIDLFVLPFCVIIYLLNGLDRSNIGNAQTDGFTDDLGMPKTALNTASSLFFATFVPFQPISAAIGKRVGQPHWLAIIAFCWGLLTLCHAFVKNQAQFIALRLLMGFFEAGFFPTCTSYLATWYPRFDLALRIAIFQAFYAIAGAFGGLIAYGCFHIRGPLYGWQYLFILEGAITMFVALITPIWMAPSPDKAWFLDTTERAYAVRRMIIDTQSDPAAHRKITKRDVIEAFTDWKIWAIVPFNTLAAVSSYGFSIFFPLVVQGLGYSGATANLMTVPPYVLSAILVLAVAYSSDHFHERTMHILFGLTIVIIGLICDITLPLSHVHARYGGLVVLLAGSNISYPILIAWLAGNTPEPGKRTVLLGINGYGNLGGIIGSELFLSKYGPTYRWPLKVTVALVAASWVGFALYHFELRYANHYRAKCLARMTPEEIEDERTNDKRYADKKRTFVYGL
ncbi:hypothetical protein CLAIMM_14555 [Cladophialophora immunda]|nr:hypothetical protein CLAIMM_14555 [Cladophialophora immunda]